MILSSLWLYLWRYAERRVIDTLPKHWGGAGSAAVSAQLEDKANSHQLLLQCLQKGGCLPRLPPNVLRCSIG